MKRRLHKSFMTTAIALSMHFLCTLLIWLLIRLSLVEMGYQICIILYYWRTSFVYYNYSFGLITYVRAWAQVFDKHKK
jgi:putative membrane protein